MLKSAEQSHRRRLDQSWLIFLKRQQRPVKAGTHPPPIYAICRDDTLSENPLKTGEFFNRHPLPGKCHGIVIPSSQQTTSHIFGLPFRLGRAFLRPARQQSCPTILLRRGVTAILTALPTTERRMRGAATKLPLTKALLCVKPSRQIMPAFCEKRSRNCQAPIPTA